MTPEAIEEGYYHGLAVCAYRYYDMTRLWIRTCEASEHWTSILQAAELMTFIVEFEIQIANGAPLNKLNRWLGYIQGVLIMTGQTTVKEERDFTRPLFRHLDYPDA